MKTRATGRSKEHRSYEFNKKLYKLTVTGGFTFWVTSIATSLLPIAAKYRAAYSDWSLQTVWIGSLFAGIIIGCCVSYFLLRFFGKIPTENPILKSGILSSIALVIAIILIDVSMILHAPGGVLYYFLIGVVFNTARFLFLGIAIGYLYKRLYG
jgi:hypothetical protein